MILTIENMAAELNVPVLSVEFREERCPLVLVTKPALLDLCRLRSRRPPDVVACSADTTRTWESMHAYTRKFGNVLVCYESPAVPK